MLLSRHERGRIAADGRGIVFRCWRRATIKAGGTLRTAIGVLAVDELERVRQEQISEAEAEAAGFSSLAELIQGLGTREGEIYRIALRLQGADPRIALRANAALADSEVAELRGRLAGFDKGAAWTQATLALIGAQPEVRAEELARSLGQDKAPFKRKVRKLKELGLTESLEVGYRLSARGRALLARL